MFRTISTAALLLALALPASADNAEKADAKDAKDAKKPDVVAFVGGRVLTGTGKVHAPGTIVAKDGVIEAVGPSESVTVPEGARVVDAKGYWLCPGFVVTRRTAIGLKGGRGSFAARYDRFHPELELCHAVGITSYFTSDGTSSKRANTSNAVIRLIRDRKGAPVVIKSPVAVEYDYGAARMSDLRTFESWIAAGKKHVAATAEYHAKLDQWKKDLAAWRKREAERAKKAAEAKKSEAKKSEAKKPEAKKPEAKKPEAKKPEAKDPRPKEPTAPKASATTKAMAQVLEGKLPLRISARRAAHLTKIVALCKQHGIRSPIIEGAGEGWVVGPALASVGARAIVAPRARFNPKFEGDPNSGWTIENAHRLDKAGVEVALCTPSTGFGYFGMTGDDALTFRLCAAFAVRGGMSNARALTGITASAAKILGVGDKVGSLTKGRFADISFFDRDPLHYRALVEKVYVDGRLQYERSKSTWLRHIKKKKK